MIAIPASSANRLPDQNVLDLALGRRFGLGPTQLKLDVQLFNIFNEDAHDWWQTLEVSPGDQFLEDGVIAPRRVMLRISLEF